MPMKVLSKAQIINLMESCGQPLMAIMANNLLPDILGGYTWLSYKEFLREKGEWQLLADTIRLNNEFTVDKLQKDLLMAYQNNDMETLKSAEKTIDILQSTLDFVDKSQDVAKPAESATKGVKTFKLGLKKDV